MSNDYGYERAYVPVGELSTDSRAAFITRTYNHLMGSIVAFTLIEFWLFMHGRSPSGIAAFMMQGSWLLVLGALHARQLARQPRGRRRRESLAGAIHAALAGFVIRRGDHLRPPALPGGTRWRPGMITSAALVTLARIRRSHGFVAFSTRKDFNFLGSLLRWGFVLAMVAHRGPPFSSASSWGRWFSVAIGWLRGARRFCATRPTCCIHFPEDRHVAAALQLFRLRRADVLVRAPIFISSRD